ncbi:MAG: hypothetical protein AB9897_01210 [Anaerolineaceae bacterium]
MGMEFSDWITQKYIAWRGDAIGQDRSITQFAAMLGLSQSQITQYMKKGGKKPSGHKAISALVNIYGDEVFEILGYQKADYQTVDLSSLPGDLQDRFRMAIKEIESGLKERKLSSESPEGLIFIRETFAKFGLGVNLTSKR